MNYRLLYCQQVIDNPIFIGQLATSEMSCYIYMCKNCLKKLYLQVFKSLEMQNTFK